MSTVDTKLPLAQALEEAAAFRALFDDTPYRYIRWEVAGSVRRRKSEVGDIEHVVIPSLRDAVGLFGEADPQPAHLVRDRALELLRAGTISLHDYGGGATRCGTKLLGFDFRGRLHELFCCRPESWGCILAIRTGPADFSRRLVTALQPRAHSMMGGWLHKKVADRTAAGTPMIRFVPLPCPDEETLFAAAGIPFVPPEKRT